MNSKFVLGSAILLVLLTTACNDLKEDRFDYAYNSEISRDFLQSEAIFISIFKTVFKAGIDTALLDTGFGVVDSASVGRQGNFYNFSYGSNKLCPDGSRRSGGFSVSYTNPLFVKEASAVLTFSDLVINGKLISGSFEIENITISDSLHPIYNLIVNDAEILIDEETKVKITWEGDYYIRWSNGFLTMNVLGDDLFKVTGSSVGRGRYNDRFNSAISDSLDLRFTCNYLRGSTSVLRMPDFEINKAVLDYLDPTACSSSVNAVFSGKTPNGSLMTSEKITLGIVF
ncbi:MAG: hypothetical protein Q7J34_06335 [Bacteroidales bacterium]|nr:hypothetical protein [Bacteroidales bacterium]